MNSIWRKIMFLQVVILNESRLEVVEVLEKELDNLVAILNKNRHLEEQGEGE